MSQKSLSSAVLLILFGALSSVTPLCAVEDVALGKVAEPFFSVGTALNARLFTTPSPDELNAIVGTFTSITSENEMKPESLQREKGKFTFEAADRFVAFGEKHKMKIVGHCLVWANQTPTWMTTGPDGKPLPREEAIANMKAHILTVVGRYKGRIHTWDVVNEAWGSDGKLNETPWFKAIGPDYIELAFRFAREADPQAKLCYNDFNLNERGKCDAVVRMVKEFKRKGVPIDLVGMQTHISLGWPRLKDWKRSAEELIEAGVKIAVTEMDVSVLPAAWGVSADITRREDYAEKYDPYRDGLPARKSAELAKRYAAFFGFFLQRASDIDRVTVWGLTDAQSWLNDFPVKGRVDYPLLFDRQAQPKPVLVELVRQVKACNPLPRWALGGFVRPEGVNPVIKPNLASEFLCPMQKRPIKWEESDTFNPAAAIYDGKIHVLYRAEDNTHQGVGSRTSRLGLAVSEDGIHMKREPKPVLFPGGDDQEKFDCPGGCEDPRIAVTEDGLYVMTYTSWNRQCPRLCVATSRDLRRWTKHGPAFAKAQGGRFLDMGCKSGAIVTAPSEKDPSRYVITKVNGKYLMYWGEAAINAAMSDDLVNWDPVTREDGSLRELVKPRPGFFDSVLTEVGPAAIKTPYGIVVLYNGKNGHGAIADKRYGQGTYCGGQVLFDGRDPCMSVARLDEPYFRPLADFERKGQYAEGTVFTEGLVFHQDKWYLYYGCADSLVGVAVWDPKNGKRVGDPL